MSTQPLLTLILGAGKGTRMKSARPKVMHAIAGRSMLGHVMATASAAGASSLAVVVGPGMDDVAAEAGKHDASVQVFVQTDQRGTGDAVLAARAALTGHTDDVLVMFGDTPLITVETTKKLVAALAGGANVAVLGFQAADPTGYGRLLTDASGALIAIREHDDAHAAERAVTLCNSGLIAFRVPNLLALLDSIKPHNAKGELYLTDVVELARASGLKAVAVIGREDEMLGINARAQLAQAEGIWQDRARARFMAEGVTLIEPKAVWFAYDTTIGRDVIIQPNVFFMAGCSVADNAEINAFSHFEGASIGSGTRIGPFARFRPGAKIGDGVHVGNFVEVKNATLEAGAKANHLSYIGDGRVGAGANIGAGTIFCNYDGFNKHFTDVGAGAFIGSNTALVAPVKIGDGAMTAAGSAISRDVAAGALAIERSPQEERPGWATRFREMMSRKKKRG